MDLRPLGSRPFRRILAAETVNIAGDWLGQVALTVLVYDRTGSAAATAVLFLAMQIFPAMAGPALVARFEGFPARKSLPLIYIGEAVMFVLLAWQSNDFLLAVTTLLVFVNGCLDAGARALVRLATATVLKPRGLLQEGNSLLNLVFTWGWFIFAAVAGALVAWLGVRDALLLDAATFMVAALLLAGVQGLPEANPEAHNWRRHLKQGVAYVRSHPQIRALLIAAAIVVALTDIIYPVEVILVKKTFGAGDSGFGLFLAVWGFGAALGGAWFVIHKFRRLNVLLLFTVILLGISFIVTALAPTFVIACAGQVIGGIGNGLQVVAIYTLVQNLTEDHFQGRVVALLNTALETSPGIGFAIGGLLGIILEPRVVFMITGLVTLVAAAVIATWLKRLDWSQ